MFTLSCYLSIGKNVFTYKADSKGTFDLSALSYTHNSPWEVVVIMYFRHVEYFIVILSNKKSSKRFRRDVPLTVERLT